MKSTIKILTLALLLSVAFSRTSGKYGVLPSFTKIKTVAKSEFVPGTENNNDNSVKWKRRHKRRKKARNRKPERGR